RAARVGTLCLGSVCGAEPDVDILARVRTWPFRHVEHGRSRARRLLSYLDDGRDAPFESRRSWSSDWLAHFRDPPGGVALAKERRGHDSRAAPKNRARHGPAVEARAPTSRSSRNRGAARVDAPAHH